MARPGTFVTGQVVTKAELDALGAVYTSGTRPTGADVYEGLHIWETDTDRWLVYDGTGWIIMAEPTQTYTPTLTNMTLGSGTRSGWYHRSDGWIDFAAEFVMGAGSAMGAAPAFSLPVAVGASIFQSQMNAGLLQNGIAERPCVVARLTSGFTSATVRVVDTSAATASQASISATFPHTWTTNDRLWVSGRYPMSTRYL